MSGETPGGSAHFVGEYGVSAALMDAERAQANAFAESSGQQALTAWQGMEDTKAFRQQVEEHLASNDPESSFDRTLFRIPATVPDWLPTSVARLFGTQMRMH